VATLRSVYGRSLHDQRRALLGWVAGVAGYTAFIVAFYPTLRDSPQLRQAVQNYPETLRKLFAIGDLGAPEGFLQGELLSLMVPLLLIVHAVLAGGDATAGEEERRTIDLLLANPVRRRAVIAQQFAALVTGSGLMGAAALVVLVGLGPVVGLHVGLARLAGAMLAVVLLAIELGTLALAIGAATGRRGLSRGLAGAAAAAAYLLSSLAPLVPGLRWWRVLSPYYHAVGAEPLRHGLSAVHTGVLAGGTAVLVGAAMWLFERRDLAS
jgi:ABC-2 type transport system permease protein